MIKKALFITLITILGACSNSDDAARNSSISTPQKTSSDQILATGDAQQDAAEQQYAQPDDTQGKQFIDDSEQASIGEIEEIVEDDSELSEAQAAGKVTLRQGTDGQIEWQTPEQNAYDAAEVVIVTPNGERITRKFAAGQAMALEESLPDGLYKWESVVTPELDPYVKEEMRSARESGDLQAQQQMTKKFRAQGALPSKQDLKNNRQSGAFIVRDGIATPTTTDSSGQDERG